MLKKLGLSIFAVGLTASIALGAGAFNGFPIIGDPGNDVCLSFGNNGVCNQFSPAGPTSPNGTETIPADTNNANGVQPSTVLIPNSLAGSLNGRVNRLIGGDFGTNLWQRGTTPLSAATPSTSVIGADRWAVYSSGNTVTVIKETAAADTIPASGFYASMRVSRPSSTNTSAICTGQVLDKQQAAELIGQNGILSFYALAGAGLAAVDTNNNLTVTLAYYTAADSATPLTNTDAFMKGTITGYQAVIGGASAGTTATITSNVAAVPISTTWTRYAVWGKIPATNASGTAVTGVGVTICYTPASGTGGSTEWFEVTGVQLQSMPSTVSTAFPNGITTPTGFERRFAQLEADYQQYYSQVVTDGAATVRYGLGQVTTTTNARIVLALAPMREIPTTTVGTTTSFGVTIAAGTAAACSALAGVASTNTTSTATLDCTTSGVVAGSATQFTGAATGGLLTFSAEP